MDITTFIEPKINLERIAELLDGLGHEGRWHTIRTWSKEHQKALFEAAKGFRPLDLDFLVPSSVGPLTEVRHWGNNTLGLSQFSRFQKRFVKIEGEEHPIAGYNEQRWMRFTGPGYFVAYKGEGEEHEGELVIDYTKLPKQKPESWPEIVPSEGLIGSVVSGGQIDYIRGISNHVSIGTAYQHGKHRKQWFAMVREDPN